MKVIEIKGTRYQEADVKQPAAPMDKGGICAQCAFFNDMDGCAHAIQHSGEVFGGDCTERDVIYTEAA